jgi:hypothetical protein
LGLQSILNESALHESAITATNGDATVDCDDCDAGDSPSATATSLPRLGESFESDIFELSATKSRSFRRPLGRNRQESTSLQTHPILDDNLQDFHQAWILRISVRVNSWANFRLWGIF